LDQNIFLNTPFLNIPISTHSVGDQVSCSYQRTGKIYMWERPTKCTHFFINLFQLNYQLHCYLCILIVIYVFLLLSMYSYCYLRILRCGYPDWGFSMLFPR
jgi:hypothetical protein